MLTKESVEKLNQLLRLPATGQEQDWDVELADADRIGEFLALYESPALGTPDRFALMTLIVASVDRFIEEHGRPPEEWLRIGEALARDRELHETTLSYWRCDGEDDPEGMFHITQHLRELWN